MKKHIMLLGALALALALIFAGCKDPNDPVTLTSIGVTTQPTKTAYVAGESFSSAGLVVSAGYSDGTSAVVTAYALTWNGSALAEGNTAIIAEASGTPKTITVTYQGKTADFTITVTTLVNAAPPQITAQPQNASYIVDQDAAALAVTATTIDGGALTYQWYSNTANSNSGGTAIVGATEASYMPSTKAADTGTLYYYVVVTNTNTGVNGAKTATATSTAAAITVIPLLTGSVNITGTAQVGQSLTANTGSLGGSGAISYQWLRGDTAVTVITEIYDAVSSTYALTATDQGKYIKVQVSRAGYSGTVESPATTAVAAAALPALTGTVSVTGTAQVGQSLTANTGSLGGSGAISYQWIQGASTNVGTNSATYIPVAFDVGQTIKVRVSRAGYSGTVTSPATLAVAEAALPTLAGTVAIDGTAQVGQTLSAVTTSLNGSGDISYQWIQGASTIVGTNSDTYIPVAFDVGQTIKVRVSRDGYSGTVESSATAAVAAAALPALTGTVAIDGTAQAGETLWANTGSLGGSGDISYQWIRGASTNIGTNSATYVPVAAEVGYTIKVQVSRDGYSGTVESPATTAVAAAALPALTGTVSITGTAQAGETLTANTGSLGGAGAISYQWLRGDTAATVTTEIYGAVSSTYALTATDQGKYIKVRVSRDGYSGTVESDATAAVVTTVSALNLTALVTAPVRDAAPDITAINTEQYTGTIEWYTGGALFTGPTFAASTIYRALVTLDAKSGYTFSGVGVNNFIHLGADTAANGADSGTVTITFPATQAAGSANITVGFNYGEITITGSDGSNVISQSGAYGPTSLSLSATGYTNVIWYVDGSQTGISGSPATINAADYTAQKHSIIFTGTANGRRYSSQAIPFTVLP
jgi:hypothetical protein